MNIYEHFLILWTSFSYNEHDELLRLLCSSWRRLRMFRLLLTISDVDGFLGENYSCGTNNRGKRITTRNSSKTLGGRHPLTRTHPHQTVFKAINFSFADSVGTKPFSVSTIKKKNIWMQWADEKIEFDDEINNGGRSHRNTSLFRTFIQASNDTGKHTVSLFALSRQTRLITVLDQLLIMNKATTGPKIARIPHRVQFWSFLISDVISLSCTFVTLYFLLSDRILRRALNNHVIIVLLVVGLIYELTVIPWSLHNNRFETPWSASPTFYLFWVFFDYSLFSLQIALFAWATIERHILIFHDRWVSTAKKRFFIHYLPISIIIAYCMVYYSIVYFVIPCQTPFDRFLAGGTYAPCAFDRTVLGTWDLMFHQVFPTLLITCFSLGLVVRVVCQKIRVRQPVQWRKHRKMTIQLVAISIIYVVLNGPWVVVTFAHQCGLSSEVVMIGVIYGNFLNYFIIFSFPLVTFLSLSELRTKLTKKIACQRINTRIHPGTQLTVPTANIAKYWSSFIEFRKLLCVRLRLAEKYRDYSLLSGRSTSVCLTFC